MLSWQRMIGTYSDVAVSLRRIAGVLGIAVLYAITGRLGLLLDPVGGFATLVWAPTGIALAALALVGLWAWPGVYLGALAANVISGAPLLGAAGVAAGNTLEAVFGALVLRRLTSRRPGVYGLRHALTFLLVAMAAPLVSASIGVVSLRAAGTMAAADTLDAWRAWWVGDFIGALLVAPVLLAWSPLHPGWSRKQWGELAVIGLLAAALASLAFVGLVRTERYSFLQAYILFPVLLWTAVRFDQRGSSLIVLLVSVIAVTGTTHGGGPFARAELRDSLFMLQTFMGIIAASFLILSAALTERAAALAALGQALAGESRANQAKSEFLSVMSHELRTPLNAIGGYAQMLAMHIPGPLTEKQRDAITRICHNQQHLASLVDDVLGFSRMEAGRLVISAETVPLCDLLAVIESFVRPELERKNITLVRAHVDGSLAAHGDPERMRQILVNLVSNAVKYTGDGGRIDIGVTRVDHKVRVSIRDTGIGIPADQLHRVFEPFYQVDRGTTRRYPGLGLGLSISRDLARAMQGDVGLESQPRVGTTVWLELPAA